VNPELGGEEGFACLAGRLRERGMGILLDLVPNHMCVASPENWRWNDLLENGPASPYAAFFDVDWDPPKADLKDRVLLPVLGDQYGRVLEAQELRVACRRGTRKARPRTRAPGRPRRASRGRGRRRRARWCSGSRSAAGGRRAAAARDAVAERAEGLAQGLLVGVEALVDEPPAVLPHRDAAGRRPSRASRKRRTSSTLRSR
jgi:hypothetical protein